MCQLKGYADSAWKQWLQHWGTDAYARHPSPTDLIKANDMSWCTKRKLLKLYEWCHDNLMLQSLKATEMLKCMTSTFKIS